MKKKLLLILALGFIVISVTSSGLSENIYSTNDLKTIELEGRFKTGGTRSGYNPISATLNMDGIEAVFHMILGNISITISNNTGVEVFDTVVNTNIQTSLFISLIDLPAGIYNITLYNDTGSMYSNFEWNM